MRVDLVKYSRESRPHVPLIITMLAKAVALALALPAAAYGLQTPIISPRSTRPSMVIDRPPDEKILNPLKVIATVVAQADIVGVPSPFRVPDAPPPIAAAAAADAPLDALDAPPATAADGPLLLPNKARREVDRDNIHPLLKLGDGAPFERREALLTALLALPTPLRNALLLLAAAPLLKVWPLVGLAIASRKHVWEREVAASAAEHRDAFDATWREYRDEQQATVEALLAARAAGTRDPALPAAGTPFTVAVTMSTGQEGASIVKALSAAAATFPGLTVRALVRNPASAKAQELAALPRVELVRADSVDAASLEAALSGVHAAYLCTTLNYGAAGKWAMDWDGGAYEV